VYTPQECELKCNEVNECFDFILGKPNGTNNGECRLYKGGWLDYSFTKYENRLIPNGSKQYREYGGISEKECLDQCLF